MAYDDHPAEPSSLHYDNLQSDFADLSHLMPLAVAIDLAALVMSNLQLKK